MKNRKKIKQFEECARVWINEDLTLEKRREWAELRLIVEQAGREGLNARQAGDIIIVEGIRYGHQDLHKLPDPLCLENGQFAKRQKAMPFIQNIVVFQILLQHFLYTKAVIIAVLSKPTITYGQLRPKNSK